MYCAYKAHARARACVDMLDVIYQLTHQNFLHNESDDRIV